MKVVISNEVFDNGVVAYTLEVEGSDVVRVLETVLEFKETLMFYASTTDVHLHVSSTLVAEMMTLVESVRNAEEKLRKFVKEVCKIKSRGDEDV